MTETFATMQTSRIAPEARRELGALMRGFARRIGAGGHVLFEHRARQDSAALVACDWPFDFLAGIGADGLHAMVGSGHAGGPGDMPREHDMAQLLGERHAAAAAEHGYTRALCQSLPVGDALFVAIYCGSGPLCAEEASLAHMRAIYALSRRLDPAVAPISPRSVRERECLSWVAEGKTTEEVAMILGVSAHTINAYIAKAIQKVDASNRAMAIATAIRAGMI